ncbi:hypothetical protein CfE428DRAFT_3557 [Chthoniobacter flavus Ellin428]|uniref:Uncharacterized protein n=1 Tax=Chthoniobacter flavus Ellin428 TaxID=497964 RepID=B4D3R9_9BACT|nr:hypothetical protein CfE428DRAFT_3557 [Chthoniobacter flavus Ellin428]
MKGWKEFARESESRANVSENPYGYLRKPSFSMAVL